MTCIDVKRQKTIKRMFPVLRPLSIDDSLSERTDEEVGGTFAACVRD